MDKEKYKKALEDIKEELEECFGESLDDFGGACVCCLYPCWKVIAKEAIEKQIKE